MPNVCSTDWDGVGKRWNPRVRHLRTTLSVAIGLVGLSWQRARGNVLAEVFTRRATAGGDPLIKTAQPRHGVHAQLHLPE